MSGEITETLHLFNLERQHIGEYSCSSKNDLGENHSSTITLRVQCKLHWFIRSTHIHTHTQKIDFIFNQKCARWFFPDAPRCKPGTEQTSVGSINMHSIDVRCEVDADPADHVKFSWTYNNTRNVSPVSIRNNNKNHFIRSIHTECDKYNLIELVLHFHLI